MTNSIQFTNPNISHLGDHITLNSTRKLPLIKRGMHEGARGAVVCGSGPSLMKPATLRVIREKIKAGWHIFTCNEATKLLRAAGLKVDYSVTMDPGTLVIERTFLDHSVTYCLASSCHPKLFEHVIGGGCKAMVYHSACGWANEVRMYKLLYGCGDTMIGGFTVVNRAFALSDYMGFPRIVLAGADFGWRPDSSYYAKGAVAPPLTDSYMSDDAKVDGKPWHTRPDLLASAITVARLIKNRQVVVVGDSLAASLAKRDDAFINEVGGIRNRDGSVSPL